MKIFFLITFLCACFPAWTGGGEAHDIHISLCEMKWNEETSSFEASLKIFIDDLELALAKENVTGLGIGTAKESASADDEINQYLVKHFRVQLDDVQLTSEFLGKEVSEDFQAIWCYIEFPAWVGKAKKCLLSNDILMELYDDQRNIMDIRMNKSHRANFILQPGSVTWSYSY